MSTIQTGPSLEHKVGPRGRFVLRQSSGEISIKGVEGDTIRVRDLDGESLDKQFAITTGDDFVELRQHDKFGIGISFGIFGKGESSELAIEVPHGATVSIESASADIEASD